MFNKFNIKDLFQKHFGARRSRSYDKRLIHPVREWLLGLAAFGVVIAVGSAFSVQTFLKYQNITTDGGVFQGTVVPFNNEQSNKVLDIYAKKAEVYAKLEGSVPVAVIHTEDSANNASTTSDSRDATTTQELVSTSSPVHSE